MAIFDASGADDGVLPQDPSFTLASSIEVDVGSYLTVSVGTIEWLSADGLTRIVANGTFTHSGGVPTGGEVTSISFDTQNDADIDATITYPAGPRPDITDLIAGTDEFWLAALAQSDTFTLATTPHPDEAGGFVNTYFGDFYDLGVGETLVALTDTFTVASGTSRFILHGDGLANAGNLTGGDDMFSITVRPAAPSSIFGDISSNGTNGTLQGGDDTVSVSPGAGGFGGVLNIYGDAELNLGMLTGGADTLAGFDRSQNNIYGDVNRNNGTVIGGNDTITGGSLSGNVLVGDVNDQNAGSLTGGDDTITGGALADSIYGDYRNFVGGTIVSGGADILDGASGDDMIFGNEGDDTLIGGADDDTLDGGAGTDTADFSTTLIAEFITVNLAAGSDQAVASMAGQSLSLDTDQLISIENVIGTAQGDSITGNSAVNRLEGRAGSDFLDGGANADTMLGGADDDTYIVDNAGDVVTELAAEGTDTVQSTVFYILPDNVENLSLLDTTDINGVGNALANILIGNGGNNILDGVGGADTMSGGSGNDIYVVDNAGDIVSEAVGQGTDQVNSSVGFTLFSNLENLSLLGSANVDAIGNELANILIGNAGSNTLDGLAGADNMAGGLGDDIFVVDNAGDTVSDPVGGGTEQVNASVSFALVSNIENLSLLGSADIDAIGNELANNLFGNSGDNTLDGLGGADNMV
ncbi:MAG: calcium-binding protein, partial [Candidatus Moraniibacteriota bacterium]